MSEHDRLPGSSPLEGTLRVIQWATGPVGRAALHQVITNPAFDLVGLLVYSPEKDGVDAGALVGLPDTGVFATTDREAVLRAEADVVIYLPRMPFATADMDADVTALLRSGKNVVTATGYWYPPLYGAEYVRELEDACAAGQVSLFGTGENPGFFMARLAPTVAAMCAEITSIRLAENIHCESMSASMALDTIGFGKHPDELVGNLLFLDMLDHCFHEELGLLGDALGAGIDSFTRTSRYGVLDHDIEIALGPVKAGHVVAQSHTWTGHSGDPGVLSITNTWSVHREVPGWELDTEGWTVTVEGRPSVRVTVRGTTSLDRSPAPKFADTDSTALETMVAAAVVNAIPRVCAGPPGILYPDTSNYPAVKWAHPASVLTT